MSEIIKKEQQQVAPTRKSIISELTTLRNTLCPDANDEEIRFFSKVCEARGLNPFKNQIHLIIRRSKDKNGNWIRKPTIQVGIDGYRATADKSGKYAGNDDYIFDEDFENGKTKYPKKATATVWKMVEGQRVAFTSTARWSESAQTKHNKGDLVGLWATSPATMLGKVAETQALRKAFPEIEIYDEAPAETNAEEMPRGYKSTPRAPQPTRLEQQEYSGHGNITDKQIKRLYALGRAVKECTGEEFDNRGFSSWVKNKLGILNLDEITQDNYEKLCDMLEQAKKNCEESKKKKDEKDVIDVDQIAEDLTEAHGKDIDEAIA